MKKIILMSIFLITSLNIYADQVDLLIERTFLNEWSKVKAAVMSAGTEEVSIEKESFKCIGVYARSNDENVGSCTVVVNAVDEAMTFLYKFDVYGEEIQYRSRFLTYHD